MEGSEIGGTNEFEQVGDENHLRERKMMRFGFVQLFEIKRVTYGLTSDDVSLLSEGTSEKRGDNGKGRAIDFANPNGRRETLDGSSDGSGVGHTSDEIGDERLNIGVREDTTESDTGLFGGGRNLSSFENKISSIPLVPHSGCNKRKKLTSDLTSLIEGVNLGTYSPNRSAT